MIFTRMPAKGVLLYMKWLRDWQKGYTKSVLIQGDTAMVRNINFNESLQREMWQPGRAVLAEQSFAVAAHCWGSTQQPSCWGLCRWTRAACISQRFWCMWYRCKSWTRFFHTWIWVWGKNQSTYCTCYLQGICWYLWQNWMHLINVNSVVSA